MAVQIGRIMREFNSMFMVWPETGVPLSFEKESL